ncbi:MAG: peptidyl-alpha-hydroxyglycine alpha-amidating lyase family protein [Pirellulaceae bacterium]|nr:peptidyl-alpha-hydroxyglycine alpha-amidating lyase family protein [Pirellulaceae bacterium]
MINRRKRFTEGLAALIVVGFLFSAQGFGQEYVMDPSWPKPLPEGIEWGQVPNVTIDEDGYIYAFHRSDPPVLKFDKEGNLVDSFGSTNWVATPHGFRVTPDGDIWATDYNPQSGHTITKIDTSGRILLRLGARGFIGTGPNTFNGPTDVAQAPNGSFFVADGHWNNRIVKFDKDGRYVMEWGKKGSGQGDLNVPHTIVIDRRGRVLVGDRSNERIQIFNQDGEYLDEWDQFGRPSGMFIDLNDVLYVADYEKLRRVTYGSAEDGTVTGFIEGSEPEGIVVDAEGNVYTGEVTGGQGGEGRIIRKFIKQ